MQMRMNMGSAFRSSIKMMEGMIKLFDLDNLEIDVHASRTSFGSASLEEKETPPRRSPYDIDITKSRVFGQKKKLF